MFKTRKELENSVKLLPKPWCLILFPIPCVSVQPSCDTQVLIAQGPFLKKVTLIAALWTPFAILVDESNVIPYDPVLGSLRAIGHQVTSCVEQFYLILVCHCLISWLSSAISDESIYGLSFRMNVKRPPDTTGWPTPCEPPRAKGGEWKRPHQIRLKVNCVLNVYSAGL
jgi:hypothetical protein